MRNGFAMSLFLYTMTCERESPENIRDDAKVGWVCKQGLAHRTCHFYRKKRRMASVNAPLLVTTIPRMRGI